MACYRGRSKVLAFGRGDTSEMLALGRVPDPSKPLAFFRRRGAEAAGGGVLLPAAALVYRRRAHPWRAIARSTSFAAPASTYATCWARAPLPLTQASTAQPALFLAAPTSARAGAARAAAIAWQLVVALLTDHKAAATSLHSANLALALAQQLSGRMKPPHLIVLTSSSLAPVPTRSRPNVVHGGTWGLARVLRLELPALCVRSVGLAQSTCIVPSAALLAAGVNPARAEDVKT